MPTLTLVQTEGLVVRTLTRCRTNIDIARSVARASPETVSKSRMSIAPSLSLLPTCTLEQIVRRPQDATRTRPHHAPALAAPLR